MSATAATGQDGSSGHCSAKLCYPMARAKLPDPRFSENCKHGVKQLPAKGGGIFKVNENTPSEIDRWGLHRFGALRIDMKIF